VNYPADHSLIIFPAQTFTSHGERSVILDLL
jgi:hypothetical protein